MGSSTSASNTSSSVMSDPLGLRIKNPLEGHLKHVFIVSVPKTIGLFYLFVGPAELLMNHVPSILQTSILPIIFIIMAIVNSFMFWCQDYNKDDFSPTSSKMFGTPLYGILIIDVSLAVFYFVLAWYGVGEET